MPAVTICNQNRVSCTHLKSFVEQCKQNMTFCDDDETTLNYSRIIYSRWCNTNGMTIVKTGMQIQ